MYKDSDWLFVFFIKDIEVEEGNVEALLKEVKGIKLSGRIKIVVLREKIRVAEEDELGKRKVYYWVDAYMIFNNTGSRRNRISLIKAPGINYNKKDSLAKLLEFVLAGCKTKYRILFTFSHGAAYGVYNVEPVVSHKGERKLNLMTNRFLVIRDVPDEYWQFVKSSGFFAKGSSMGIEGELILDRKYSPSACSNLEIFWISELQSSLKKSLSPQNVKIDILIMNNCLMQIADNGFILRDVVDFIIAPETMMAPLDYNIKKLIQRLSGRKPPTIENLVQLVIRDFREKPDSYAESQTAIFGNRLTAYGEMVKVVDEIAAILKAKPANTKIILEKIFTTRIASLDVTANYRNSLVDMLTVLMYIYEETMDFLLGEKITRLTRIIKESIIENSKRAHVGLDIIKSDQGTTGKKLSPQGISISLPPTKDVFEESQLMRCSYWGKITKSPFAEASAWDDLLKILYSP